MKKYCLFVMLFCLATIIITSSGFAAQPLRVAFGETLPPYVIPATHDGIVVDILREALEPEGYSIQPFYYPYARRLIAYKKGKVDIVSDVPISLAEEFDGFFSGALYAYENVAISLKKHGYTFSKIDDLLHYRVLAWQGAKEILGGEYADMAERNTHYREIANQKAQVIMLFKDREDVIQIDKLIFQYFHNELISEEYPEVSQEVDIFPLFGVSENGFVFKDQDVQRLFNKKFRELKESGRYDEIVQKYVGSVEK